MRGSKRSATWGDWLDERKGLRYRFYLRLRA
jgi:hypothetical protein